MVGCPPLAAWQASQPAARGQQLPSTLPSPSLNKTRAPRMQPPPEPSRLLQPVKAQYHQQRMAPPNPRRRPSQPNGLTALTGMGAPPGAGAFAGPPGLPCCCTAAAR